MQQTSNPLPDDERTVLLIAARGQVMLAIGRWEKPIRSLAAKGYMRRTAREDVENYEITEAGLAESEKAEAEADAQWAGALRRWGK